MPEWWLGDWVWRPPGRWYPSCLACASCAHASLWCASSSWQGAPCGCLCVRPGATLWCPCVCECVCVFVCVHVCVCVCASVWVSTCNKTVHHSSNFRGKYKCRLWPIWLPRHTHIHVPTPMPTPRSIHIHTHSPTHPQQSTYPCANTHTCTHAHAHTQIHPHIHTQQLPHPCAHTYTCTHALAHTHIHTPHPHQHTYNNQPTRRDGERGRHRFVVRGTDIRDLEVLLGFNLRTGCIHDLWVHTWSVDRAHSWSEDRVHSWFEGKDMIWGQGVTWSERKYMIWGQTTYTQPVVIALPFARWRTRIACYDSLPIPKQIQFV